MSNRDTRTTREKEREKSELGVLIKGLQCAKCGTKLVRDLDELDKHAAEEHDDERGIVEDEDDEQSRLITDGGRPNAGNPHEPGVDAETPDDLDGIDLDRGDGCPHCGAGRGDLYMPRAGYYACIECGALWAGVRENASLMEEPHSGPATEGC